MLYLLIWTDNDPEQGYNHADFSLNASGEQLGLFASASEYFAAVDTLTFGQQTTDVSIGRLPNGEGPFITLPGPTPGFSNYAVATEDTNGSESSMLIFSEPYTETQFVQLTFSVPADRLTLQILSLEGRIIFEELLTALQQGTHTFSMSTVSIPAGLYLCKAVFNDNVLVKKFILH